MMQAKYFSLKNGISQFICREVSFLLQKKMLKEHEEHQPENVPAELAEQIAKNTSSKCRHSNTSSEIPFRFYISNIYLIDLYFCLPFSPVFFSFFHMIKQEGKPNQDSSLLHPVFTPLVNFSLCLSIYLFSFSAEKPLSLEDF